MTNERINEQLLPEPSGTDGSEPVTANEPAFDADVARFHFEEALGQQQTSTYAGHEVPLATSDADGID